MKVVTKDDQKSTEKHLPAAGEKCTPVGTLTYTPAVEDISVDTPAGVLKLRLGEENVPAGASTAPCTPAAAGRGGCREAATGSVNHTPAGVDTWCTPRRRKKGSSSKRRSLLLYR